MTISTTELRGVKAIAIDITDDTLAVDLADRRSIAVPLAWYPRLFHGTSAERANWRLIGNGEGIHWEDLDEDISVEGLLLGYPSAESQSSLQRWLQHRTSANTDEP